MLHLPTHKSISAPHRSVPGLSWRPTCLLPVGSLFLAAVQLQCMHLAIRLGIVKSLTKKHCGSQYVLRNEAFAIVQHAALGTCHRFPHESDRDNHHNPSIYAKSTDTLVQIVLDKQIGSSTDNDTPTSLYASVPNCNCPGRLDEHTLDRTLRAIA